MIEAQIASVELNRSWTRSSSSRMMARLMYPMIGLAFSTTGTTISR
jgi:hypothetical protein